MTVNECAWRAGGELAMISAGWLSAVAEWRLELREVNLQKGTLTDKRLKLLLRDCPRLQRLNLSYNLDISDSGLQAMRRDCLQDGSGQPRRLPKTPWMIPEDGPRCSKRIQGASEMLP